MIKLENTEVLGWEHAIRGMRNPMNSWEKSDSGFCETQGEDCTGCAALDENGRCTGCLPVGDGDLYFVGHNDHDLMMRLAKGGPVHAKYRRMIVVYVDITAPLYWWKEFDTYKVGTVANSCSTMHKIAAKEFTLEDFSCEHIGDVPNCDPFYHTALEITIGALNEARHCYLDTKDKKYWWQMIQLLPSSYNQKRTVMLNYEVLASIHPMRKDHKLDEWHTFCDWIEELPYSEIITGIDWKKANPILHTERDENGNLLRGMRAEVPGIIEQKWPSTPEEVSKALGEWDRVVERIKNGEIPTSFAIPIEDTNKEEE